MQNWRLLEDALMDAIRRQGCLVNVNTYDDKIVTTNINVTTLAKDLSDRVTVNVKAVRVME